MSQSEVFENNDDFENNTRKRKKPENPTENPTEVQEKNLLKENQNGYDPQKVVFIKGLEYNISHEIKQNVKKYQSEIGKICGYKNRNECSNWKILENCIRITTQSAEQKSKLLALIELCGKPIQASEPWSLKNQKENQSKTEQPSQYIGIVFGIPSDVDMNLVIEDNVALQLKIISNNVEKNTSTALIWFENSIPDHIMVENFLRFRVQKYMPRPMQCKKCWAFGHLAKFCENEIICKYCTKNHESEDCMVKENIQQYKCVNCKRNHQATATTCEKFIINQSIIKLANKVSPPLPFKAAQNEWNSAYKEFTQGNTSSGSRQEKTENLQSFAEIVSGNKSKNLSNQIQAKLHQTSSTKNSQEKIIDTLINNSLLLNKLFAKEMHGSNDPEIIAGLKTINENTILLEKYRKPGVERKASGAVNNAPRTNSERSSTGRPPSRSSTSRPTESRSASETRFAGHPLPQRVVQVRSSIQRKQATQPAQPATHKAAINIPTASNTNQEESNSIDQPQPAQNQVLALLHQLVAMMSQPQPYSYSSMPPQQSVPMHGSFNRPWDNTNPSNISNATHPAPDWYGQNPNNCQPWYPTQLNYQNATT
jgi:hypothetical protein